ncbi:hypothetical protein GBF38_008330 [Nibea albiflora]|uniref:Uncharacterized protein n=1 Tax=Nibea albiflora TaxID=240163 RepID=A0ACB7EZU6_NIBAL|nr:hypothetical protein GBF38_008330 [Nibea albiflora]
MDVAGGWQREVCLKTDGDHRLVTESHKQTRNQPRALLSTRPESERKSRSLVPPQLIVNEEQAKEEIIKMEDSAGRRRENDNGCSPTTTLATRRTRRQTPAESTGTPEDEAVRTARRTAHHDT